MMKVQALLKPVLPALGKRTIFDIRNTKHILQEKLIQDIPGTNKFFQTSSRFFSQKKGDPIKVGIIVSNKKPTFAEQWTADLNLGQSLYIAMDNLRKSDHTFNFTSLHDDSSHPDIIVSMCGMPADRNKQERWQITKKGANVPLNTGPGSIIPENGDQYTFNFTNTSQ